MRGGFLHQQIVAAFQEHFPTARTEFKVGPGKNAGYVDLFAGHGDCRIVIEVELTPDRVPGDFEKAATLLATHLFVVFPTTDIAQAACRRHARLLRETRKQRQVFLLSQGQALAVVRDLFPLISASNVNPTTNQQLVSRSLPPLRRESK